ncbi:hypothetical protein MEO93_27805 [Dolichospermum sp. ST_sed3]|nr:hypothetical protein [Dolichospermum sp. ST_sed3]
MKKVMRGRWMFLFLLAAACSQEQKTTKKFFDFDGLIDEQVSQLSQRMRVLDKVANMGKTRSDTTFLPSFKGWESELEIFRQLETFNRPTYQNVYRIEDPVEDSRSNLKIKRYVAEHAPIPVLRFYYQDEFSRLRKIDAEITEKNILYSTHRVLTMEFDEDEGKPLLIRYGMSGFQKMIMRDTVHFSVQGQIDW